MIKEQCQSQTGILQRVLDKQHVYLPDTQVEYLLNKIKRPGFLEDVGITKGLVLH